MTEVFPASPYIGRFQPFVLPTLGALTLSEDEKDTINRLQSKMIRDSAYMKTRDMYYNGVQSVASLGIAIPPQLADLRHVVGWPRFAVDPYADRLSIEGFRVGDQTDVNTDLWDAWVMNGMPAEEHLAWVDALSLGRAYFTVGSAYDGGDVPRICAESPLNMVVTWDPRTRKPKEAWQTYFVDDQPAAALYVMGETTQLVADDAGQWAISDRDRHGMDVLPVVAVPNKPRTSDRSGRSEISWPLMNTTDAACRMLVNLAVAGELYSVPQKYILGATEADFQKADGTPVTGWETYLSSILGLERGDDGELPTVGQFKPYDPSIYTSVVDMYAAHVASETGATPQELGLYTQGNPPSADSVNFSNETRQLRVRGKQRGYGPHAVEVMQLSIRFQNGGDLPSEFERIEVDWMDPSTPTPGVTTDAITKQIGAESVPARSDVTLKKLGYSAVERRQLAQDWKTEGPNQALNSVADKILNNIGTQSAQPGTASG